MGNAVIQQVCARAASCARGRVRVGLYFRACWAAGAVGGLLLRSLWGVSAALGGWGCSCSVGPGCPPFPFLAWWCRGVRFGRCGLVGPPCGVLRGPAFLVPPSPFSVGVVYGRGAGPELVARPFRKSGACGILGMFIVRRVFDVVLQLSLKGG